MEDENSGIERFFLPIGSRIFFSTILLLFGVLLPAKAQEPTITSFSPATVCQGESVTITGTDFTEVTNVRLGTANATDFTVNSPTSITAVFNRAVSGIITVIAPDGNAISDAILTVTPTPKPALTDIGAQDVPFSNCDASIAYQLIVSNSSVATGTGNVYRIDWGDNTPAFTQTDWPAGAQTSHTYNSQGYFPVVLTITSSNGCSKSVTYQFYKGRNPVAFFSTSTSTTALCTPSPVEFQIGNWSNNSPGTTYVVDFGDGSPAITLQHPLNATNTTYLLTHVYTKSSCPNIDFTASLKVTNGCYTTTYTLNQIIIRQKPVADFGVSATCTDEPVCFTNQTQNGYTGNSCSTTSNFIWDFGDGTTSAAKNPLCHTYAAAGTYTVTLTATNAACGSDAKTKQIIVTPVSPPPVAATPIVYCQGQPAIPLTATGIGLLWYSPTTGTSSSTAPTPPTNVAGTRTYYVSQTLPGNCESPRVPVTVTVNAIPVRPAVTTPVNLCLDQPATPLTAAGNDLLWYTDPTVGTGSATAPTPSTTTPGNTTWYVSQTVNGCEGPRATITVKVNPLAVAPGVTSPITYCQNQSAARLAATGTGLLWYTSDIGGTGSSRAPTPSTAIPGSTTYYVSQTTTCGESPRASIVVNVNASPSASISYNLTNLCNVTDAASAPNPPVNITQTGTPGGSYSISPATGLPIDATTGTIDPSGATAGKYTIRYTIPGSGVCPDYNTTTSITISGAPAATISYAGSPYCNGTTTPQPVIVAGVRGGIFSAGQGLSINSTTGAINPALSVPGKYIVTYTIAASSPCPGYIATTNVEINENPVSSLLPDTFNFCINKTPATLTVNPLPGNTIKWYDQNLVPLNGAPVVNTSAAAMFTYYVSQSGSYGCESSKTKILAIVHSSLPAPVITARTPLCVGDDLVLQAYSSVPGNTVLNYLWKGPGTGYPVNASDVRINNIKMEDAGIYSVTVTSPETGCSTTADTLIQVGDYPVVKFAQTPVTLPTGYHFSLDPVITNAANPGVLPIQRYTWTPSQDLTYNDAIRSSATVTIRNEACYTVTATNLYGCSGSGDICVKVLCQNSQVFVPNAFTPTGNVPENRKLMVRATAINMVRSFRIFNRWGKIVFERNNFPPNSPDFGWDGQVNGKPADAGVYVYTVDVICENGTAYSFKGNVTLL